uniref:VWFA domain-containing protein n=1 Tax=Macrostomum lignano TaxID=282301 RepID=A0A1I8FVH1_9PLAT
ALAFLRRCPSSRVAGDCPEMCLCMEFAMPLLPRDRNSLLLPGSPTASAKATRCMHTNLCGHNCCASKNDPLLFIIHRFRKSVMSFIRGAVAGRFSFGVLPRNARELSRDADAALSVLTTLPSRWPQDLHQEKVCSCKPVAPRPGKRGSLIFVVDDTGSMGRVITAVRNHIQSIIRANKALQ